MKIITKYWKIILAVAIVAFCFSIYYVGVCNGKRNAKVVTIDTTTNYLKKVQKNDSLLTIANTNLQKLSKEKSDSITILKKQIALNNIQTINQISQVKKLSLDSSIKYMASTFDDKTPIKRQVDGKDTGIAITPKQVIEHNVSDVMKKSCERDYQLMNDEVILYFNMVTLKDSIIKNDSTIIADKTGSVKALQIDKDNLKSDVEKITKKYEHQKFWKSFFVGTTFVAVIYGLLK